MTGGAEIGGFRLFRLQDISHSPPLAVGVSIPAPD
jgi:hypothetical protein